MISHVIRSTVHLRHAASAEIHSNVSRANPIKAVGLQGPCPTATGTDSATLRPSGAAPAVAITARPGGVRDADRTADARRSRGSRDRHQRRYGGLAWVPQHFLSHPFQVFQSVPLLARVAAAAEGMTIGTSVVLLTPLNPAEVAENAATLDARHGRDRPRSLPFALRAARRGADGELRWAVRGSTGTSLCGPAVIEYVLGAHRRRELGTYGEDRCSVRAADGSGSV
jgi:hypothetical protein